MVKAGGRFNFPHRISDAFDNNLQLLSNMNRCRNVQLMVAFINKFEGRGLLGNRIIFLTYVWN